jgi:hypothetical protein
MIVTSSIFLLLMSLMPVDTISLPREFNRLTTHGDTIYLAPFAGTSIYAYNRSGKISAVQFTDNINYRILDFVITPFALYLNNGSSIQKYFFSSGALQTVVTASSISGFSLTRSGEIVYSEDRLNVIVFLDFLYEEKFAISNVQVYDIAYYDNKIYALTPRNLIIFDEHGNELEMIATPEICKRLCVSSRGLIVFTQGRSYVHILRTEWEKITFTHSILDITVQDETVITLNDNGSTLSIYHITDF